MATTQEQWTIEHTDKLSLLNLTELSYLQRLEITFGEKTQEKLSESVRNLEKIIKKRYPVYGITTGFGPLVAYDIGNEKEDVSRVIAHLACGYGPPTPEHIVRLAMILRIITLSKGYSAINPDSLQLYANILSLPGCVVVPQLGSVGASGDLLPLAHVAMFLFGQGSFSENGNPVQVNEFPLLEAFLDHSWGRRDLLALVNGTSFSTAWAMHAAQDAWHLLLQAEYLSGCLFALLGAGPEPLQEEIHILRGYHGQLKSARSILKSYKSIYPTLPGRNSPKRLLQEPYSIRCAPQVLGSCRDNFEYTFKQIETEVNGIDDNPTIFTEKDGEAQALHGGNFFAQQIAFAADLINQSVIQMSVLVERQLSLILNPHWNNNEKPFLCLRPGRNSGLAGLQICIAGLLSELRSSGGPVAISSVPTNGDNQDIVPMALNAARRAYFQIDLAAGVVAALGLALRQYKFLRFGSKDNQSFPGWLNHFVPIEQDRPLANDLQAAVNGLLPHRVVKVFS